MIRVESDFIGELVIPCDAYYGIQSLRAKENFNITGRVLHPQMIISLAKVKKAAAMSNRGELPDEKADAIISACDEIISGQLHEHFIVDPVQGGAGTSANMNANEVIANRANEILGGNKGEYDKVHPNDHVNMCQSTNDVFPTAGKITLLVLVKDLLKELEILDVALSNKAEQFYDVIKMGRTQLQDAVPIRLGQEFGAYAKAIKRDIKRIINASDDLKTINMGGTAVGTMINASEKYLSEITRNLIESTEIDLQMADDLVDGTQNQDAIVSFSGALKTCAVNLSKIANDLRLMSSGPRTGIGEINLPKKQNGSSIMPGKVNPVIPEVVSQIAFEVIGNDVTVTMAAEAGQLELNAFEPIAFYNLINSLEMLTKGIKTLVDNCIVDITANRQRCEDLLNSSASLATALCPYIGYKKSCEIAKEAMNTGLSVKDIAKSEGILDDLLLDQILDVGCLV
ncbi:MAG: aspartate ammonia-lyase [Clostridiales bacterium]|nr:aspartate ammonia-lyase [Clostridiales bacterium]